MPDGKPGIFIPPPGIAAPAAPNELISAKPLVTADVMIAGLTYPAEAMPLKNWEFKNVPMGSPSWPDKKLRISANGFESVDVAWVDTGEVSCCNADGTVEISCCSCDCTPLPVLALVACVTAEDCRV